jgi:8-oxo-dGTP pyrophosphatase MutT (NUDIX family)
LSSQPEASSQDFHGASPARCDNTSVGIIIADPLDRFLIFDRATAPPGAAPCAGHVDEHGSPEAAAIAEVHEELGLTVETLTVVAAQWRDNSCRRPAGLLAVGHQWTVYRATAHGRLSPSPRETRNTRWATRADLQALYARTLAFAAGKVPADQFEQHPGLLAVWGLWFSLAGIVNTTASELALLDTLTWP